MEVDGCASERLGVTSGVPQGSVLGPVLFLIYINDITSAIDPRVSIKLFADDCLIFKEITGTDDQVLLNSSLTGIGQWCTTWGMSLNADKTVLLRVTKKKQPFQFSYSLNGAPVVEKSQYKYLGITFTNTLSWSKHIENICASATRKLGLLRHKLKASPTHVKLLAFKMIILPKLQYASVVWDPFLKKDKYRLEMVQRRAIRFIFNKYRTTDSPTSLMLANSISTLEDRRKIDRLKLLFALYTGSTKVNASVYIQPFQSRPTRHRHTHNLLPYRAHTNMFKNSFFPRTVSEWNSLPEVVFTSQSICHFERAILSVL